MKAKREKLPAIINPMALSVVWHHPAIGAVTAVPSCGDKEEHGKKSSKNIKEPITKHIERKMKIKSIQRFDVSREINLKIKDVNINIGLHNKSK